MLILRAAILAALFLCSAGIAALANDITLTSRDGTVELTGLFLGFDGEYYRIETEYGVLTVDGSGVNCSGPACPDLGGFVAEFTISGARSIGTALMTALIESFALRQGYALSREELDGGALLHTLYDRANSRPAARIIVRANTSDEGFADLLGEEADLVMSLREATAPEVRMVVEAGLGDLRSARQARVIALDALVPVVAPGNPVTRLSMAQLADIFSGKITDWSQLGGEHAPITLHLPDPGLGIEPVFIRRVMRTQAQGISGAIIRHPTNAALARAVADDPFGIGIASFSHTGNGEAVILTGSCGFEVPASSATIKSGDYPLTAPVYLYMPARHLPRLGREFLAYLRSDAAQLVIRRARFVDQMPGEVPIGAQGDRLANAIRIAGAEIGLEALQNMINLLGRQKRLSITFRFEGGSTLLDEASRSNVALLAHLLESGWFDSRKLTFVGFSDGQGAAEVNLRLSQRRAETVRDAVRSSVEALVTGGPELLVAAFGEAMPMACDDTAWGRKVNRRVEVWLE